MTTIAYIGNFRPERSTENAYRYAFERLGCKVIPIQQELAESLSGADTVGTDLLLYTRTHNHTALERPWTDVWR